MSNIVTILTILMGMVEAAGFILSILNVSISFCKEVMNIRYKVILNKYFNRRFIMRRVVGRSISRFVFGTLYSAVCYIAYKWLFDKMYACINVEEAGLTVLLASIGSVMIVLFMTLLISLETCRRMNMYNQLYDKAYDRTNGKVESVWI